jgi:hypothetical protein
MFFQINQTVIRENSEVIQKWIEHFARRHFKKSPRELCDIIYSLQPALLYRTLLNIIPQELRMKNYVLFLRMFLVANIDGFISGGNKYAITYVVIRETIKLAEFDWNSANKIGYIGLMDVIIDYLINYYGRDNIIYETPTGVKLIRTFDKKTVDFIGNRL